MERMKHTGDYELDTINMLEQECADLEEENKKLKEELEIATKCSSQEEGKLRNLEKENKKLKEKIKRLEFDVDAWHQLKLLLEGEIERLRGLQICGKTVAERIEDDKKVVRE